VRIERKRTGRRESMGEEDKRKKKKKKRRRRRRRKGNGRHVSVYMAKICNSMVHV
jgi:hypothetical protein